MSNKSEYRRLCESESSIPLFSRDWWLDAACGKDNWDVVLVEKDGEIKGSFPYLIRKKLGQTIIMMPKLTLSMGPWICPSEKQNSYKRSAWEDEVVSELIDSLPNFNYFNQNLHYSITNWMPFYWRGFHQTTRYTYMIPDLTNLDKVHSEFNREVCRQIRRAEDMVKVTSSDDIAEFYKINSYVFDRQGIKTPYDYDYVKRLDSACQDRGCRKILLAKDENDQVHAALYFVWSEESAYALMSGIDPRFREDGSQKLLFWEAIKISQSVTKRFNFAGSMMKTIARALRGFGNVHVPYSNVTKANGFVSKLVDSAMYSSILPQNMWSGRRF
jgi:hypothetical protein